jgi:hypothetical protein
VRSEGLDAACRALTAANAAVRRNALQLFVDAFPLQDPGATQACLRNNSDIGFTSCTSGSVLYLTLSLTLS